MYSKHDTSKIDTMTIGGSFLTTLKTDCTKHEYLIKIT